MRPLDLDALERDGWVAIPGLLTVERAGAVAQQCLDLLGDDGDQRRGRQAGERYSPGG